MRSNGDSVIKCRSGQVRDGICIDDADRCAELYLIMA